MADQPDQPDGIAPAVPLERAAGAPQSRRAPAGGAHASPPGEGGATGVPPAGQQPGLRGKAFRDAVKAATVALNAGQRRERGKYPAKGTTRKRYQPGMARRMPPQPGDEVT